MAYVDGYVVPVPNMPMEAMPFDDKRKFRGGFKPMVSLVR
jgi:uncharacterized protein YbaA (DUF1428 family)